MNQLHRSFIQHKRIYPSAAAAGPHDYTLTVSPGWYRIYHAGLIPVMDALGACRIAWLNKLGDGTTEGIVIKQGHFNRISPLKESNPGVFKADRGATIKWTSDSAVSHYMNCSITMERVTDWSPF